MRAGAERGLVLRLLRWLGPWTPAAAVPRDVMAKELDAPAREAGERPMRLRVYAPEARPPVGALLLVQGLHYAGPDDPRMDRFARILAQAGILVCAPFLPDFGRLLVTERLVQDTARGLDALLALPELPEGARPGAFSISFGSMPALRLAAARGDALGGLVVFGGYADFADTIRFALEGAPGRPHDPLNRPVVFLNLLDHLDADERDREPVAGAWRRFVRQTWGRPELKAEGAWEPIAHALAGDLRPRARDLFLLGCGLRPGARARVDEALARAAGSLAHLDPRPHLTAVRGPVFVAHGRDDDVIPCEQAELIAAALPSACERRVLLTGMYAHTGKLGLTDLVGLAPAAAREVATMMGILTAIARVATGRGDAR